MICEGHVIIKIRNNIRAYKLGLFKGARPVIAYFFQGGPLTCYFDEKHILKLCPLSSSQYVSTIPGKKNCMLPTSEKSTFCKGLYSENDGLSI